MCEFSSFRALFEFYDAIGLDIIYIINVYERLEVDFQACEFSHEIIFFVVFLLQGKKGWVNFGVNWIDKLMSRRHNNHRVKFR